MTPTRIRLMLALLLIAAAVGALSGRLQAAVLWSDLGATLVHETGSGRDILGAVLKRDDSSSDTLYFKFHVDPLSDVSTEEYVAAFALYEADSERLALGNSFKAWAYSAWNTAGGEQSNGALSDVDLRSSRPESFTLGNFFPYEFPRRGNERTVVFKVRYIPGADDQVTVWLNPELRPGAAEVDQPESLTTRFRANASFDQIRLRHSGGGAGWIFSDMAIATSFSDFVDASETGGTPQRAGALQFTFRTWQREHGLPQNSVRALAQTRDGYLWVGSDDGIARFDGVRFVSFGLREGLRSGRVRALLEDRRGALWIGTAAAGLILRQNGHFTTHTIRDGLPADSITALAEDVMGGLWIGTEAGLVRWPDGRADPGEHVDFRGRAISVLFCDGEGRMWIGVRGVGIFEHANGAFLPLTGGGVEELLQDCHALLVDQRGRIWVGAGDDLVLCRDGGEWRRYRIPRRLARPYITALAEEPNGTIWAGSVSEGLFQFKDGRVIPINASSGLSDNLVQSLLVDREGKLWVGTAAGLNRLRERKLSTFGQNEGLGYGAVHGLAEVVPGVIWAGKPNDGLYRWEGAGFKRLLVPDILGGLSQINALLVARDGSCWVAASKGLLCFPDAVSSESGRHQISLEAADVVALAEDRGGALWAGTREGELWQFSDGVWKMQSEFGSTHAITAIAQDAEGSMWIGTEGSGLFRIQAGKWTRIDNNTGLLSDFIRTLYVDSDSAVWIGTAGGGLSRWRAGQIATFTTAEGLPDNTISQVLEDASGRLWFGTHRGIAAVSKQDLEQLAAGRISTVYPKVYGRAEGMLAEECTGGFYPSGLKTKSGLLYFSTLKGIVGVDPRSSAEDSPPPSVLIEEIIIDALPREADSRSGGDPAMSRYSSPVPAALRVAPGKHRIELRYTALNFDAPEQVRFRYRLEGLDPDWVEAGSRRSAFYSYVPPGDYRFRVIACNNDGIWSERGAELAVTVMPYFWQKAWFIMMAGLVLFGTAAACVRVVEKRRLRRRLRILEQEHALERERARIAQDLHDDLGSSLARISLLGSLVRADKEHPDQVEAHVKKIAKSADETVRALEEIVWAVRPGNDSLQSLVEYIAHFATEFFEGHSTRCRLHLPHDLPARPLPPEMRHNIFLIVKESLTNVLKHAGATEVHVSANANESSLEIIVQDDGRGFDPGSKQNVRNGLGNMRQRAENIGARLNIQSSAGAGTMVALAVNFARNGAPPHNHAVAPAQADCEKLQA